MCEYNGYCTSKQCVCVVLISDVQNATQFSFGPTEYLVLKLKNTAGKQVFQWNPVIWSEQKHRIWMLGTQEQPS